MGKANDGRSSGTGKRMFFLAAAFLLNQTQAQAPVATVEGKVNLGAGAAAQASSPAPDGALRGAHIANAEVRVTSSGDTQYLGMTNTDAEGRFNLAGVPAGGINVQVWRNGALIARGAALLAGANLNEAQLLHIDLVGPETRPKTDLEDK